MKLGPEKCLVGPCPRDACKKGYCRSHYERVRRGKSPDSPLRKRAPAGTYLRREDVLAICQLHASATGAELAAIFGRLDARSTG